MTYLFVVEFSGEIRSEGGEVGNKLELEHSEPWYLSGSIGQPKIIVSLGPYFMGYRYMIYGVRCHEVHTLFKCC